MGTRRGAERRQRRDDVEVDRRSGERRRWPRVPVHLWGETTDGEATYFHQAADLSAGGVFFETAIPLPVGTVVSVRLDEPAGGAFFEGRGVVVNVPDHGRPGMGVRFVDVDEAGRARLEAAVARLSP